jgi:hypothetical protein
MSPFWGATYPPKNHLGLKKVAKWQKLAPSSHPVQGTLTKEEGSVPLTSLH